MFDDLDTTFSKMLMDPSAPPDVQSADISFLSPGKSFAPSQRTLNLFLYEVKENRLLRDPVPYVEKVGKTYVRRLPPSRFDCTYIVTAWSTQTGAAQVAEEHRTLSLALLWLTQFRTIPESYLQGMLTGQPFPMPLYVAQVDPNKHAGEFWNALGSAPRPAFNLVVTIAMDPQVATNGFLVQTHQTSVIAGDSGPAENLLQIGGLVRTGTGEAIAGATVDLDTTGPRTFSDGEGHYVLTNVAPGSHTLRAIAVGFQPATIPLTVPGPSDGYDIVLTPL